MPSCNPRIYCHYNLAENKQTNKQRYLHPYLQMRKLRFQKIEQFPLDCSQINWETSLMHCFVCLKSCVLSIIQFSLFKYFRYFFPCLTKSWMLSFSLYFQKCRAICLLPIHIPAELLCVFRVIYSCFLSCFIARASSLKDKW